MVSNDILAASAEASAETARSALDWLRVPANRGLTGAGAPRIERDLRLGAVLSRRLAEAARRPMAVAVFGASQVGKSHLISVLARKGEALMARFPDLPEPVNYITTINPDRGKEATGLVTRFTIRGETSGPAGFPVHLRLLSHGDIVKILANAYFFDGMPGRYETWPEREEIEAFLAPYRGTPQGPEGMWGLTAEDVWDLEEYFKKHLGEFELTKRLGPYWHLAAEAAPKLALPQLADFLSLLWGRHAAITDIYRKLIAALHRLGFASDAFAPFAAIDIREPDVQSILDVEALGDLIDDTAAPLELRTSAGASAVLPRPVVTALTAELVMTLSEKPWDFFDHTDLLDFPGYRTRGLPQGVEADEGPGARGLAHHLQVAPRETIAALMLRGKVEYLFQRYAAEQEITAMLLCVRESNLDVTQLADVVFNWIGTAHGARPEERVGKQPLLFFVFTRFDMHFEKKTSDSAMGLATRFGGRMQASLIKPFGANPDTWVHQWTPDEPFRNCFLMRNPNVLNGEMFVFDGQREAEIRSDRQDWVVALRDGFVGADHVADHFRDPAEAFDEMMRLNDGGAGHIARSLAPVCNPAIKTGQIAHRLVRVVETLSQALKPFYTSSDVDQRLAERTGIAERVGEALYRCDEQHGRFGSFLGSLMMDSAAIADLLYEASVTMDRRPVAGEAAVEEASAGDQPRRRRPWELTGAAAAPSPSPVAQTSAGPEAHLARAAMRGWTEHLLNRAGDPHLAHETGIASELLRELIDDISTASRRLDLQSRLSATIGRVAFKDRRDEQIAKATLVAERMLNGFVSDLGASATPEKARPVNELVDPPRPVFARDAEAFDANGIGPTPATFRTRYVDDWITAYFHLARENALGTSGLRIDPVQNARLGALIGSFAEIRREVA